MTGPKADMVLWPSASPLYQDWGYCTPHLARPAKDGVAGVMGEGDCVLRPREGEDWQLGGWAPSARSQAWGAIIPHPTRPTFIQQLFLTSP